MVFSTSEFGFNPVAGAHLLYRLWFRWFFEGEVLRILEGAVASWGSSELKKGGELTSPDLGWGKFVPSLIKNLLNIGNS